MPELPELVYIEKRLRPEILNRRIIQARVWEPIVLRVGVLGRFEELLPGRSFSGMRRRGPFLVFSLAPLEMIVHFMLAGRFRLESASQANIKRLAKDHCWSLALDSGAVLHYLDSRRMGKIYLIRSGETAGIPGFDTQGTEVLSEDFTLEVFKETLEGRRQQIRVFLMDQQNLSAIGNAYADEILFVARIHPKTGCHQLAEEDIDRLYGSVRPVLQWGIEEVERAAQPIDVKVRGHLKVRNRRGQPCTVCGTTIRRMGVLGYDAFFCPKCQPALKGRHLSWEKFE